MLHSFRTENKLTSHEKICKNKDFCGISMPSEKNNILEFNQYMKLDKLPYIIYADIESLIRKIGGCANNPEKSATTKIVEHIPCAYSMSTIWGFDHIEDKHTLYHRKDCMRNFCTSLREHAKNIIDFDKRKMLPLTKEELNHIKMQKYVIFVGKKYKKKFAQDKNY